MSPTSHTHITSAASFSASHQTAASLIPDRAQLQLWMHNRQRHKETPQLEPFRLPRALGQRGPRRPWGVRKHCMPSVLSSNRPQNHHQSHIKGRLAAPAIPSPPRGGRAQACLSCMAMLGCARFKCCSTE